MPDSPGEALLPSQREQDPAKTLDWYIQKRNGKKRDYVFSVSKMRTCPHNHLHAMVVGGIKYRCEDCNWCFDIVTTYAQPLHNVVVGSLLQVMHSAKEFGIDAVQEMLRTPKGQHEYDYHLPALPEGISFWDAVQAMEQIDINRPDQGAGQLRALLERYWVSDAERQRRHKELAAANPGLGKLLQDKGLMASVESPKEYEGAIGLPADRRGEITGRKTKKALGEGENGDGIKSRRARRTPEEQDLPFATPMPRLPRGQKPRAARGNPRGSR